MVVAGVATTQPLKLARDCLTEDAGADVGFANSATAPAGAIRMAEKLAAGVVEVDCREN